MKTLDIIDRIKAQIGDRSYIVSPNGHGLGKDNFEGAGKCFDDIAADVMIPSTTHDHQNVEDVFQMDQESQTFMEIFRLKQKANLKAGGCASDTAEGGAL